MRVGEPVICLGNFFTDRKRNISKWLGYLHFELIRHDVIENILLVFQRI